MACLFNLSTQIYLLAGFTPELSLAKKSHAMSDPSHIFRSRRTIAALSFWFVPFVPTVFESGWQDIMNAEFIRSTKYCFRIVKLNRLFVDKTPNPTIGHHPKSSTKSIPMVNEDHQITTGWSVCCTTPFFKILVDGFCECIIFIYNNNSVICYFLLGFCIFPHARNKTTYLETLLSI